jgi:uroporphyrinogen-III synthase
MGARKLRLVFNSAIPKFGYMKNILITRDETASAALLARLDAKNYRYFFEPLFSVKNLPIKKPEIDFSAIIITSANACFALQKIGANKEIKIFTVGKHTAKKLNRAGFNNVVISKNNSAESLLDSLILENGKFLYLRGLAISFDFKKHLKNVFEIIAYETIEIENFSAKFAKISYDEVYIFSQNSCRIFHQIISRNNLLEYFASAQILCLSPQIAEYAKNLGFAKIDIFSND